MVCAKSSQSMGRLVNSRATISEGLGRITNGTFSPVTSNSTTSTKVRPKIIGTAIRACRSGLAASAEHDVQGPKTDPDDNGGNSEGHEDASAAFRKPSRRLSARSSKLKETTSRPARMAAAIRLAHIGIVSDR